MNVSRLDGARKWGANRRVTQLLLRQFFARFAGNQQGLQPVHFLQRHVVSRPGALKTAGCFVELLLRNQIVLIHLLRAAVFVVRVKKIRFRSLHGSKFFRVRRRRVIRADAKLRANLRHQSALPLHFKLQFLRIQRDQRLAFLHRVAHVGQHFVHSAIHLRTQRAFLQRKKRAHGLDAASRGFLGHGVKMHGRGVSGVSQDAARLSLRTPTCHNCSQ